LVLVSEITLNIHGAKQTFTRMFREDVPIAVRLIRDQIQKNKQKPELGYPIVESIPIQIKKLAELRDSGIITEKEFNDKKTELLKRM
jgi:hypothetical protein